MRRYCMASPPVHLVAGTLRPLCRRGTPTPAHAQPATRGGGLSRLPHSSPVGHAPVWVFLGDKEGVECLRQGAREGLPCSTAAFPPTVTSICPGCRPICSPRRRGAS